MTELFDPLCAPFLLEGSNGQAVLAIHGFTGVPAHFRLLAPDLHQAGFTVSAPLLAGHGTSIDDMAATNGSDWLESVFTAANQLEGHRRLHVVGLSMGGSLGVLLAARCRIDSLTTISTPVKFRSRLIHLARLMHRVVPRSQWPPTNGSALDPEAAALWLTYPAYPTRGAAELLRLSRQAYQQAATLSVPALVIQSRTDETVHPDSGPLLARALSGRLLWLERSRHNALLDGERDRIHEAILGHLG